MWTMYHSTAVVFAIYLVLNEHLNVLQPSELVEYAAPKATTLCELCNCKLAKFVIVFAPVMFINCMSDFQPTETTACALKCDHGYLLIQYNIMSSRIVIGICSHQILSELMLMISRVSPVQGHISPVILYMWMHQYTSVVHPFYFAILQQVAWSVTGVTSRPLRHAMPSAVQTMVQLTHVKGGISIAEAAV